MPHRTPLSICSVLIFAVFLVTAAEPAAAESQLLMARPEKPLFTDDFARDQLGDNWTVHENSFSIQDGFLVAGQRPQADHGAVSQTYVGFDNLILRFRFRLAGATGFNVVIDDRNYKHSHAGHICRVVVRPSYILARDDKTGAMRNDIFAARRLPGQRDEANARIADKEARASVELSESQWHDMTIELVGDEMLVHLDGKPLAYVRSAGIGHRSKTDFGFTIPGRWAHFDDVEAYAATAAPDWPGRREQVLNQVQAWSVDR